MREPEADRQQRLAYEKILYRYSTALERGDLDTIIAILQVAESNQYLEDMIIKTHKEGYQLEELTMYQDNVNHREDTASQYVNTVPNPSRQDQSRQVVYTAARKPHKSWRTALRNISAVLAVAVIIASAVFLFTTHNKANVVNQKGTLTGVGGIVKQSENIAIVTSVAKDQTITVVGINVQTGKALWYVVLGTNTGYTLPVIGLTVQDQSVYVVYNKQVQAFQISDGKPLWKTTLGQADPYIVGGDNQPQIVADHSRVYVSGYTGGSLYTVNAQDGKILWHYDTQIPALLTVSDGVVYVLSDGIEPNIIKMLSGTDGHELRHITLDSVLSASVVNNVLYVQSQPNTPDPNGINKNHKELSAFNITNGKQLWSVPAAANGPSPLVVEQGVVVLYNGNHFCGYASSDGSQVWCTTGPGADVVNVGLIGVNGTAYGLFYTAPTANTIAVVLAAINPQNGKFYWSKQMDGLPITALQFIGQDNSLLLVGGKQVFNRSDGKELWQVQ